jgi:hypothetical protein
MNLGSLLSNDSVINALKPQLEKLIEPMFLEVHHQALAKIAGPVPEKFAVSLRRRFAFSESDVKFLWESAIESVL